MKFLENLKIALSTSENHVNLEDVEKVDRISPLSFVHGEKATVVL